MGWLRTRSGRAGMSLTIATVSDEDRPKLSLTVPRPRTLLHGSRCILDRLSAFLSENIDSVLKGGAKVCQRQLVNVVRPLVAEFTRNLGREGATPIQRSFDASLLGRVQAVKLFRHNALQHLKIICPTLPHWPQGNGRPGSSRRASQPKPISCLQAV